VSRVVLLISAVVLEIHFDSISLGIGLWLVGTALLEGYREQAEQTRAVLLEVLRELKKGRWS
jgi:hypothetical protein